MPAASHKLQSTQKTKDRLDPLGVVEELLDVSEAAVYREVFSARIVVERTGHEHMLDGLDRLAAWAGDLLRCMIWVDALRVRSHKCVARDYPVHSADSSS